MAQTSEQQAPVTTINDAVVEWRRETLERDYERLPYEPLTQDVLGVPVLKVVIQVVAGRNIAVLVEAAVRNTILQLRGIDTYQEFVDRHRRAMERDSGG